MTLDPFQIEAERIREKHYSRAQSKLAERFTIDIPQALRDRLFRLKNKKGHGLESYEHVIWRLLKFYEENHKNDQG